MKALLVAIFFVTLCRFVQAQDSITYQPYPEQYGTWLFERTDYTPWSTQSYHRTVWSGDTTINAVTYTRIFQSEASFPNDPAPAMTYKGGVRQDIPNQKLYFIDLDNVEYDISIDQFLEAGDTIYNTENLFMVIDFQAEDHLDSISKFVVHSVDSTDTGAENGYRSVYWLQAIDSDNQLREDINIRYISGIGAIQLNLFEFYGLLGCYSEEGTLILGEFNPHAVSCTLGAEETELSANVTVFPNPASTYVTLTSTLSIGSVVMEIVDLSGKTVFKNDVYLFDESIPVEFLESGSYLIRITYAEQQAVFPLQLVK